MPAVTAGQLSRLVHDHDLPPVRPSGGRADIAEIVRQLLAEGWEIEPEDLAQISPYLTEHINRFGEYSTHELGIQPEAYEAKLDVDFTPLREQDVLKRGSAGSTGSSALSARRRVDEAVGVGDQVLDEGVTGAVRCAVRR
ncbi:Tn3 family transposase [Streptomyces sp. NPDC102259]|uniref:Tn3 family transposase n=1 Tax=Streptomyces sp. NPDC102259 TaxID=3366148 RepID=UPI003813E7BE